MPDGPIGRPRRLSAGFGPGESSGTFRTARSAAMSRQGTRILH